MKTDENMLAIDTYAKEAAEHRHYLHAHPEPSFEEHGTQQYIIDHLRSLGLNPSPVAGTGVTATVAGMRGPATAKVLLLRADIDALRLTEETGLPFASQNEGVMHACGHDGHTGTLLAVAHWLVDHCDQFGGTVKLLFQPAEEISPGGAEPCVKEGVLQNPDVTLAFGMHLWNMLEFGKIGLRAGPLMAEADRCELTVTGKGTHAATPQLGADPIVAAAQIVTALQTIVSRETNPLDSRVVTVGTIDGGSAFNIIPQSVHMTGTLRALSREDAELGAASLRRIVTHTAEALGTTADVDYEFGYPPVINSHEAVELLRPMLQQVVGEDNIALPEITMGGEDFAYYLQQVPGVFVFMGTRNPAKGLTASHHSPKFTFDEDIFPIAVSVFVAVVRGYLS
ncbi:MAG: amidohydrolase [Caldiserica bacterium]|nr:amidohydrolase [Caldisericota bacterium]